MTKISKRLLSSIAVFIIILSSGITIIYFKEQKRIATLRKVVTEVAAAQAYSISRQLDRSLSATYALASLLERYEEINNFDALAADMIERYGGISSLQLAPNAVVRQIFPLQGNEAAIGHDLLNDPNRRIEALATINSRKLTLAGPLNLIQGGVAVIGRYPVFLTSRKSGVESFWGFTIVLIHLPDMLGASNINQLAVNGYNFELSRIHPDSGKHHVFAQSQHETLVKPVTINIEVPNGEWTLSLAPKKGWIVLLNLSSLEVLITIFTATIISSLFYQRFKSISDLSKTNKLLANEIIERKRLEEEMKALSLTDELTGLYNRRGFFTVAEHHIKIAQREKKRLLLLFADVDNLKEVNDSLGHQAGDLVLSETANVFKLTYREADIIARIGGDEFVVLNLKTGGNIADTMIERLQNNLEIYNAKRAGINKLSISVGVAEYDPDSMHSINEVLSKADNLMYNQKVQKKRS